MGEITQSDDVAVDVSTAYNQWTQFEEFPRFMEVESVEQIDDRRLRWKVDIAGIDRVRSRDHRADSRSADRLAVTDRRRSGRWSPFRVG